MTPWLQDRVQPCLLDRLTDHAPERGSEAEAASRLSLEQYKGTVERDLRWLLSTAAPPFVEPKQGFTAPSDYFLHPTAYARALEIAPAEERARWVDLRHYPRAMHSTVAYGMRQIVLRAGLSPEAMGLEIQRALNHFEPRIVPHSTTVTLSPDRQSVRIAINGVLLAFPTNQDFQMRVRIDRETGEIALS